MKKIKNAFYNVPVLFTLGAILFLSLPLAGCLFLLSAIIEGDLSGIPIKSLFLWAFLIVFLLFSLLIPIFFTVYNLVFLIQKPKTGKKEFALMRIEAATFIFGILLSAFYIYLSDLFYNPITFSDWDVQLYNYDIHTPISTRHILTVAVIAAIGIVGYCILRYIPIKKQPPLLTVICIGLMYLGCGELVLWCIQITPAFPLHILPFNCILIAMRTIRNVIWQKNQLTKEQGEGEKLKGLSKILNNAFAWPVLGFVAALPALGIIVAVLILFGQEPDSVIKAWTETADWTMSQKIAPQNIMYDEHYLCTVAAGGHKKVVKPLRTGTRHGHRVLVNRQLCIANAFEQLISERTPKFHRAVRDFYDSFGYPIAKRIRSPYTADVIYFIMKPLEWLFLIVLYFFDVNPENRIAVQYPHKPLPENF